MLLIGLLTTGCDAIYRLLDKEGAQEKELIGEINPLEPNPNIEEVQVLLKIYGYNPGSVDGVLGGRTRDAIERFQKDAGLKESRFVDQETWRKLAFFRKAGLIRGNELNISQVQTLLKKAGFSPGKPDGNFGAKTKSAVMAFQKASRLTADGKVGYKTLSELARFLPPEP